MRVFPSKTDFTLYGKEPFESCRSCELTATRLCAEMPRVTGRISKAGDDKLLKPASVVQPCVRGGMDGLES